MNKGRCFKSFTCCGGVLFFCCVCCLVVASEKVVGSEYAVVSIPKSATIISAGMRTTDPTILDVVYKVVSDEPFVKVRALAFADAKRDFAHVLRPETYVEGTEANLGDHIAANVEHKLSWRVSADWETQLGKVSFEVLSMTTEESALPVKYFVRRETHTGETHCYLSGSGAQIYYANPDDYMGYTNREKCSHDVIWLNALLWYYAGRDPELVLEDGELFWIRDNGATRLPMASSNFSAYGVANDGKIANGRYIIGDARVPTADVGLYSYFGPNVAGIFNAGYWPYYISRRQVAIQYLRHKVMVKIGADVELGFAPISGYDWLD